MSWIEAAFAAGLRQCLVRPTTPGPLVTLGFVAWRAGELATAGKPLKNTLILALAERAPNTNLADVFFDSRHHREAIQRYR